MSVVASYLYAVALAQPPLDGLIGIESAPVRCVDADGLTGLVSTVDADEFSDAALARNLQDAVWLEGIARAHDDVVRAAAAAVTTVPLRLGVVFDDDDAVVGRLREQDDTLRGVLHRVDGHDEWGVKMFSVADERRDAPAAAATSGTAYLQQRRQALRDRETAAEADAAQADAVFRELADVAAAARRYPPQDPRLTGSSAPMVLNASFLVRRTDHDTFRSVVDRLSGASPAGSLVLTGPWPPYSFASPEDEA